MNSDQLAALDRAARGTNSRMDEYKAFRKALVNLYRTGKLVLIDDGAVEALTAGILVNLLQSGHRADTLEVLTHGDGRGTVPPGTLSRAVAAALSALGVK